MTRIKNCPICGCMLKEITLVRSWCPNCGIIEEELPTFENDDINYIN